MKGKKGKKMNYAFLLTTVSLCFALTSRPDRLDDQEAKWKRITQLEVASDYVPSGAFSPNGLEFALATRDRIHRWRVKDWEALTSIEGRGFLSCLYLSDTRLAASVAKIAGVDPRIVAYDLASQSPTANLAVPGMTSMPAINSTTHLLAFASRCERGSRVELLDSVWKPVRFLGEQSGDITGLAFSPKGDLLATGSRNARLILWYTSTGKPVGEFYISPEKRFAGHGEIDCIAFSPDGQWIASGGDGSSLVRVWDTRTGSIIREFTLWPEHDQVHGLTFSPDGQKLAAASGRKIVVLDCTWWKEELALAKQPSDGAFYSPAFSPDGRRFVFVDTPSKGGTHNVIVWERK
jgi:WD40 repeat protein